VLLRGARERSRWWHIGAVVMGVCYLHFREAIWADVD
jgi:hypothetical protein